MRRTQRVADEHRVAYRPALVAQIREISPHRSIRYETVPSQGLAKELFTIGQRFGFIHGRKAGLIPGPGVTLDDESAHLRRVPIVVCVERAVLVLDEGLRQRVEHLRRPVPGELVLQPRDRSAEVMPATDGRIDAVSCDDEVIAFLFSRNGYLVLRGDANARELGLEKPQQLQPAD